MYYRIAVLGLIILIGLYATLIEPQWLDIKTHDLRQDINLDSIRVVHLADLHIQNIGSRETKVINQVIALDADLIVLSGDVIDKADHLSILHSFLKELGEIPVIAVLGNWEHWAGVNIQTLSEEYQHHNMRLLVNDVASFQIRQRNIQVLGIDDYTAGRPNFDLLQYRSNDKLTLLVEHSPAFFDNLPVNLNAPSLDLCLSGHTHGGQVTFFGLPFWKPPGSGTFSSGEYKTAVCTLHVSKGIGTSILPLRFWARPEIAIFDL